MMSIADRVASRIAAADQHSVEFSPAQMDAMRMSDMFPSVQPDLYVLPLDAMGGFPPLQTRRTKSSDEQFIA